MIDLAKEPDFSLGAVQAHPALRLFGGETVEPRVMQVLVALIRRIGEVVSRDDLIALCWDGRAVSEDAIQRAIAKTRKLGGDSGAFQIETIPRVGYRLRAKAVAAPPSAAESAPQSTAPLLAVLPFENFSADPEMTFFADAVADEILQTIARVRELRVMSRASSFQFRGANKAVDRVVSELGATHILDGSVRRGGDRVRISAELVDARTRATLWQNQFERSTKDLLAVQDEIAMAVADALDRKLQPRPAADIDPETYDKFLRLGQGLELLAASHIELTDQITAAAPNFAPGWAMAAHVRQAVRQRFRTADHGMGLYAEARVCAERAYELDPNHELSLLARFELEPPAAWAAREMWLRRAMDAAPGAVIPLQSFTFFCASTGRMAMQRAFAEEFYTRAPLQPFAHMAYAGAMTEGRFDDMISMYEAMLRRWPNFLPGVYTVFLSAVRRRRADIIERNEWRLASLTQAAGPQMLQQIQFAIDYFRNPTPEKRQLILTGLQRSVARTGRLPVTLLGYACEHTSADEVYDIIDAASFAHLFDSSGTMEPADIGFNTLFNPSARELRADPRFVKLCARLGMVAYWIDSGVWPDCADEVRYDFRAEARKWAENPSAA
jgi:adenylate cyclase